MLPFYYISHHKIILKTHIGRTATSTRTTTATILTGNPSPRLGARWFILAIMPTAVEKTEF